MRQLYPDTIDPVDPAAVYGDLPAAAARPGLRLNMIESADGGAVVDGVSGGLGGAADKSVFMLLRSLADAVLVAAGTVRAEGYHPSKLPIAVVSRSCHLDWDAPFFTEQIARPMLVTVAGAPPEELARAREVADVLVAGEKDVDLATALRAIGERGHANVLAEGGPSLNAQLARDGLIDELCVTLSPRLVGGGRAKRILDGTDLAGLAPLMLRSVCEQDGFLFLRYRPSRRAP
jgi:riboflavin biosynthesis pyrimidine reductase